MTEQKLLTFNIDKDLYGRISFSFGCDYASNAFLETIKEALDEKQQTQFTLKGDDNTYTLETFSVLLKSFGEEYTEFLEEERKKQKNLYEAKKKWLSDVSPTLQETKAMVSKGYLSDLSVFYSDVNELIKVWLAEKGYNASIETIDTNDEDVFILLDNGKKFSVDSKTKTNSNGVFSYIYLEFGLEEK